MERALRELNIGGVRTSTPAALAVLEDERFRSGRFDTHILETIDFKGSVGDQVKAAAIAAALHRWNRARRRSLAGRESDRSAWLRRGREHSTSWTTPPGGTAGDSSRGGSA